MDRGAWYDGARVERTVTRQFVCCHLLPGEIENLDRPLAFGDGLTDCTYWEWIQDRAKRLFLILVDLGVPDQIFGVVDDSWEDADLPVPLDHVDRLALTATRDAKFDAKFYARQFLYLVRKLQKDQYVDYRADELVPLDVVEKRLTHNHDMDKVELPDLPGRVFCRRRFSLDQDDFMSQINSIKSLRNNHMFSYWASYTHRDCGYVLFDPVSEYKLNSFLANNQFALKNLDKWSRRRMVLDWIHCLIDTLGFIHSRGLFLGGIKPSSIFLTHDHHIFLPDVGGLCPDLTGHHHKGNSFDKESYDYAAPEQWFKPTKSASTIRRHNNNNNNNNHNITTVPESNSSFFISRGHGDSIPPAATTQQQREIVTNTTPQLDAKAADIFALACVILDLLSHGLFNKRRSSSAFAAHRAAKHKSAGRGGAIPDSSFHKNLGQVESWMVGMAKDAAKKATKDGNEDKGTSIYQAVAPLLQVVEKMLAVQPSERPSAVQVQSWIYNVVTEVGGIAEPHCVHQYAPDGFDNTGTMAAIPVRQSMLSLSDSSKQLLSTSMEAEDQDDGTTVVDDTSATSVRNGVFGFAGWTHRRHSSDNSSESQGSSSKGDREGWEMGSGLRAIQNLRLSAKGKT